jgi:hypothetical protein
MSQQLISLSPDLKRLRDEGYEVVVKHGYLIAKNVPYVNARKEVKFADILSKLTLAGNTTTKPETHVVQFTGEQPCNHNGVPITKIINSNTPENIADGIVSRFKFSSKPKDGYSNYYDLITTYINLISNYANALNQNVSARTFAPIEPDDNDSVFKYVDTASSRSGIVDINKKLSLNKVAIVGLGGTGSHVLDLIAKTPVQEIHIYDSDEFLQHNAFRSPGAPSIEDLKTKSKKVNYFKKLYSNMRNGIVAHEYNVDHSNINELRNMDFVFICIDNGLDKALIFKKLEEFSIQFIDVGMGLYFIEEDKSIGGVIRITTSTKNMRNHVNEKVSFSDSWQGNNEYSSNIQTDDLNSLNATLAVNKWKRLMGFYKDITKEHSSTYTIDGNIIINEDRYA